jgi:hypothetical protein
MSIELTSLESSAFSGSFTDYATDMPTAQLRIPPHSMEAESSVLGGLLLDNSAWDRIGDAVQEDDFYRYEHRLIFAACSKLINATKPADVITVFEALQSLGKADEVGGITYLNNLAQYVPSAANIRRYAEIVRERAILRKLLTASDEIATQAFNPKGKPVDEILDEAEQKIFKIGEEGSKNKQGFQSMDKLVVELLELPQAASVVIASTAAAATAILVWRMESSPRSASPRSGASLVLLAGRGRWMRWGRTGAVSTVTTRQAPTSEGRRRLSGPAL